MVTTYTKTIVEKYSEPRLDLKILRKRGNDKCFNGWIIQKIKEARQESNLDVAELLTTVYKKYNEFKKIDRILPEIEIIGGWKGEGTININQSLFSEDISIKIPIKDKLTKEVKWSYKIIPKENVNRIVCYINKWKVGERHDCYEFAEVLGEDNWEEVWKKRTNVYFLKYYYPIKVLEAMKVIEYSGRGEITRIR